MSFRTRLRFWRMRPQLEAELNDEMTAHREMLEERFVREGMSPEEARFAALKQFGNRTNSAEQSREEWGFGWPDAILRDLSFAAKLIRKQPFFTATAVLTVALGVGANTAVVSVLQGIVLNPLGLSDPERVMMATVRLERLKMLQASASAVEYRELSEMTDVFSAVAAIEGRSWTMHTAGEPVRLTGRAVTSQFFDTFAEKPLLGRFFLPEDREAVVLSHAIWRSQFGEDRSVAGRVMMLDGVPHRILGVAPQNFRYPVDAQVWSALHFTPERLKRRGRDMNLAVTVRLKNGITPAQAADRVNRYVAALFKDGENSGYFIDLHRFGNHLGRDLRRSLWLLWAAALVVLLTGAASIAALLLARTAGRKREIAIRLSLGATRAQIIRQLLIESLLLSALGGAAGLGAAAFAISMLNQLAIPRKELLSLVSLNGELVVYGMALSLASGLIFGLAPAVQLLRGSQVQALVRVRRHRFQSAFVAAEVAAAIVLVISTGLLMRSFWRASHIPPGFETDNVTTAFLLKPKNDPTFVERLDATLTATVGASTALAYPIPFSGGGLTSNFGIVNRQRQSGEPEWHGEAYFVSPGYFETLRIPLLLGRRFTRADAANAPIVCIIDSRMVGRFFPNENPIGQRLSMYRGAATIVGVVPAIRATTLEEPSRPVVYYPLVQVPYFQQMAVLVRSPHAAAAQIKDAVKQTNGSVAVYDIRSMRDRIRESLGIRQILAVLVLTFALICLLLATVGVNGVVSQIVGERKFEIAVRRAVGAQSSRILRQFLWEGMHWALGGLALGLAASFYLQRLLTSSLFEIEPFDAETFAAASIAVLIVLLLAVFFPAWRASRIEPQQVLRHE